MGVALLLSCERIIVKVLGEKAALAQDSLRYFDVICIIVTSRFQFLPARRYASAGLCDSDVSVRLSVRPSVTRRYCA